ncbi:developmentally regulated GTP-binding like protein [Babesia gibsoni]|uniref:Developmentally regulated GTP-binding like protein n=1 Tax=Babesia gibsoni TaxID=33632 RepID=A0AAD8PG97_BABGI|nr:developmentally regulated GTP-binding like protein [Babesia gibsoni]
MNIASSKNILKAFGELVSPRNSETFPRYQAPFVDYLRLVCKGGHGGSPVNNVNRSRRLCGPGYGGHGGDVILKPSHHVESLLHLEDTIKAKHGGDAQGTSRGKHAPNRIVHVPPGVIVRKRVKTPNGYKNIFWHQFLDNNGSLVVACGGRGGLGPSCFKKHDNRLPEVGESTYLELELRLINDVAFIGVPNSGKTSLISSLTSYMTRIGPEEGSTTRPHVAVLRFVDGIDIRLMDLPPLHSANEEKHTRILRHIYRTKIITYVLDASDPNSIDLLGELRGAIKNSQMYDKDKMELVVMNKCDLFHKETLYNLNRVYYKLVQEDPQIKVIGTSATHKLGLGRLVNTIRDMLYQSQIEHTPRKIVKSYEIKLIA